jgi:plastocyanin
MQLSPIGIAVFGSLAVSACSSSGSPGMSPTVGVGAGPTITIDSFTFSPNPLTVAAGSTIDVVNNDTAPHTATSEAAAADYVAGMAKGGFSFNASVAAGGHATITVPSGVASGTKQPFFCNIHKSMMSDPDPVIIIK